LIDDDETAAVTSTVAMAVVMVAFQASCMVKHQPLMY
jgi:hypothetical protein